MRISLHIFEKFTAAFLLWGLLCQKVQAIIAEPFEIPDNANEYLRHEKHGILAFGVTDGDRYGNFLITRNRTYHNWPSVPGDFYRNLKRYTKAFENGESANSYSIAEVFEFGHLVYQLQLAPFRKELDELYQLTIVNADGPFFNFPFEALLVDDSGPYHKRKFLTEIWAVSYLNHFDFQPVEKRGDPPSVLLDDEGKYSQREQHPNQGSVLCNRYGKGNWLPGSIKQRFWENVEEGNYIDEALGLARVEYFDSLRALSREGKIHPGLDPRKWASAVILGDIAPTHPKRGFPWWILAPIGLLLVIVFGRKL